MRLPHASRGRVSIWSEVVTVTLTSPVFWPQEQLASEPEGLPRSTKLGPQRLRLGRALMSEDYGAEEDA